LAYGQQNLVLCGWFVVFSGFLDYSLARSFLVCLMGAMGCALTVFQKDARAGHPRDLLAGWDRDIAKSARCCGFGRSFALGRRRRSHLAYRKGKFGRGFWWRL